MNIDKLNGHSRFWQNQHSRAPKRLYRADYSRKTHADAKIGTVILVTSSYSVWPYCLGLIALISAFLMARAWRKHRKCKKPNHVATVVQSMDVLSHEIRTPLSLIKGAAELLESAGPLTEEQQQFTKTIQANAEHAITTAEGFLTLAKLDAGEGRLALEKFDLRELTRDTAREMRSIHDFPILLTDSGEPLPITADPALIKHVLWNLINNAVRHAGAESQILVHTYPSANSRCIEVRDLGIGINPAERDCLFIPFQQLGQHEQTAARQGTGLGLSIVDRIVTLHGGEVLVDSLWGRGTSFHIVLPTEATQPVRRRK